jgi:hypothetical protein
LLKRFYPTRTVRKIEQRRSASPIFGIPNVDEKPPGADAVCLAALLSKKG